MNGFTKVKNSEPRKSFIFKSKHKIGTFRGMKEKPEGKRLDFKSQ